MQLRLIRLVIASFGTKLTEWTDLAHTEAAITVKPYGPALREAPNNTTMTILEASRIIDDLPIRDDVIHVPDAFRRELEMALESHIDIVAVLNQCTRSIGSPQPYIAIEPIDDAATSWLSGKRIHVSTTGIPVRMWHEFDFTASLPHLTDRLDGVALVAESLGHAHPTGQLHELIRFFERAFALAAGRVCRNELPTFLAANDKGYTKSEIGHWLHLRDTTSHADRRPSFALQADTRPVVNRVEQAAYDVLFNKQTWRDPSVDRRNVLAPFCGSSDKDGGMFLTQGRPAKLNMQIVDGYHAYPCNLNAGIDNIPKHWLTDTTATENLVSRASLFVR